MIVAISTCVVFLKAFNSNKVPLKISLFGFSQEVLRIVGDDDNAVVDMLVNNYAGQDINFVVKVVFPYSNSQFSNLMNLIRSQSSFIFVVSQMEVIDNKFYVYSRDINCADDSFLSSKSKVNNYSGSSDVDNSAKSKLLSTHHNISKKSKEFLKAEVTSLIDNLVD